MLKFLIIVVAAGVFAYYAHDAFYESFEDDRAKAVNACTLDAKVCPDGSAVGRTGPNCEFAACPAS